MHLFFCSIINHIFPSLLYPADSLSGCRIFSIFYSYEKTVMSFDDSFPYYVFEPKETNNHMRGGNYEIRKNQDNCFKCH